MANQRAQVQVHRGRAYAQVLEGLAQALQQRFVNALLHQQTRARAASLPGVLHDGVDEGRNGGIQIGIGKHDLRAFAAQLQRDRTMPFGRDLLDEGANRGAAGKADVVNPRVAGQRVAHLMAVTGHDIDGTGRKTNLGGQLGHTDQRQAGIFGRFDHAHIAGRQCAAHAAAKNLHRIVPRNDVAGHAMRLAPGHDAIAFLVGNGLAVQLVAGARIKLKIAHQRQRVGLGLFGGFAAVALLNGGEFVHMFGHLG